MKRNRIALAGSAFFLIGALTLAGCASGGGNEPTEETSSGDATAVISVNNTEPQNPLIPTNTNEVGGGLVLQSIFAGLVYYDAEGAPHNDMAESIETDDAQNYTIKLKADQTFSNGEPVTANSFVDAWNYGALLSNAQGDNYPAFYIRRDGRVTEHLLDPDQRMRYDTPERRAALATILRDLIGPEAAA